MQDLCTRINCAYKIGARSVLLNFRKKYLFSLAKLKTFNLIDSFVILKDQKKIKVCLRYYNNKPLFRLKMHSKPGNKIYLPVNRIDSFSNKNSGDLFFTSSSCGLLVKEEVTWLNIGGKVLLKIFFMCL
jgi:ribosomal protein S8